MRVSEGGSKGEMMREGALNNLVLLIYSTLYIEAFSRSQNRRTIWSELGNKGKRVGQKEKRSELSYTVQCPIKLK